MLKDITLGQYFPGDTVVHRLDPRTKLLMVIVYIVALFLAKWVISYAVMLAFLVTAVALSRIRPRALFKGLKPLLFIIIFTAIINVFYTKGDVLVQFWIFKITREGLVNAGFLVLRIVMLVTGTFLLTYTTSPIALTDGLESLLSPLKAIHFPVHELALMMSIALRFIPTLIEETDKIMSAQRARGADFESGNLRRQTFLLKKSFFDIRSNMAQDFEDEISLAEEDQKAAAEKAAMAYHKIRSGDTLGAIAQRYGTTVSKLCSLNGITSKTTLRIGRTLRVR